MMRSFATSRLALFALMAAGSVARADQRFYLSHVELAAGNAAVRVSHVHAVEPVVGDDPWAYALQSRLVIERRGDGAVVLDAPVMPLTGLVAVGDSGYFVGLSDLKALAQEYNFVVFDQTGQILDTALVTAASGHCAGMRQSVTNWRRWFDRRAPNVRLQFEGDVPVRAVVDNPYDGHAPEPSGICTIDLDGQP